jgi:hypothetical protein
MMMTILSARTKVAPAPDSGDRLLWPEDDDKDDDDDRGKSNAPPRGRITRTATRTAQNH